MHLRRLSTLLLLPILFLAGCSPKGEPSPSTSGNGGGLQRGIATSSSSSRPTSSKTGAGSNNNSTTPSSVEHEHIAFGNPTNAQENPSEKANFLVERTQYAMSFNDDLGYPNWVSWHLKAQDIGDVERGQFVPDDTLPEGFKRITPKDYTGTGYDRGHLCPSKDRSDTTENNNATFLMSNIFPQAPGNNQGPWKDLEDYSRDLVRNEGKDLYIFAGPALDRAKSSHKRVGRGKVKLTVPEDTWKVIVVLPAGDGDPLSRINPQSRVIAIWMPNLDSLRGKDWKKFRTSVDEIERQTGYELLSNLPKSLQDTLESKIDTE